jgi:hypothetical protein
MRTIQQMVQQEVLCCMSSLVAITGNAAFTFTRGEQNSDMIGPAEQALELLMSVPDYEEAAVQAGWRQNGDGTFEARSEPDVGCISSANTWEALCQANDIEPYDREVFEHWAVTDWFADKLIAKGEKVDKDFAGLCVWARTTTGQAIYADYVVEQIYAELIAS